MFPRLHATCRTPGVQRLAPPGDSAKRLGSQALKFEVVMILLLHLFVAPSATSHHDARLWVRECGNQESAVRGAVQRRRPDPRSQIVALHCSTASLDSRNSCGCA